MDRRLTTFEAALLAVLEDGDRQSTDEIRAAYYERGGPEAVLYATVFKRLRVLEADGLIESEEEDRRPGTVGPLRILFSITIRGRERLRQTRSILGAGT